MSTSELLNQLKKRIEQRAKNDEFSGAVLVAKGGEPILEIASGFANKEKGIPNQLDTKFNLGSSTKMFTGVAIAQLVEGGLLSFKNLVGKHLPDYPNDEIKRKVSVHNLLTHTAGLGSFIDIQFREALLAQRPNLKNIQSVVDLFKDRPLPYKIGEFHYSSDGYELLGLIIEAVTGQSYFDYVRENIFEIAGMLDSDSYEIDPDDPREDIAIGYTHRDPKTDKMHEGERFDNFVLNLLKGTAGGSGYSTCKDLLKFTQALLGHKLLSPEMTEEVLKPRVKEGSKGGQTKYYGYGFQIFDTNGFRRVGHPGRFAGVNTRVDMYPEIGYTVVVLSNYDPPSALYIGEMAESLITPK